MASAKSPQHQQHWHPPFRRADKQEFVTDKGTRSHISLLRLLPSRLTVAQVERYVEDEVWQHYLQLNSKYIELLDKVFYWNTYHYVNQNRYYWLYFPINVCVPTYLCPGFLRNHWNCEDENLDTCNFVRIFTLCVFIYLYVHCFSITFSLWF